MIHGIMKEGVWISYPSQIKKEFLNFFNEKFKNHDSNVDFPLFSNSSGLCALDHDSLETPISLDEFRSCLSSSRALVLVNGSPTLELSIKRGLRQGDPLSPFLLILVMEGLHNALSTAVSSGLIRGVKFGSPKLTISHLFYVDDKSNVYGIRVLDVNVFSMASNSGCASGSFPYTYLGLPFGSNMSLTSSWQVLSDRFQSKLSSWKANLLSIGCRHTLIKVVLCSLGIYYFSIFKVYEYVLNSLERSRAMFFWGGSYKARTLVWVKWKNVISSYDNNGLNIHSLKAFNLALLQKWHWRLYRLVREKDYLFIDRIDHGQWRWNWSRPILGARNSADLLDMLFEISSAEINEVGNTCVWSLGTDGTFSVKDARCIIDSKILPSLAPSTVWDKNIPRKVNIFIWRLILDRLPHKLNLSFRGIDIQGIFCPSCNGNVESSNHIFFECNIAKGIWMLVRK
ncbi:putative RNA-directed DNA polymerase, eukaryota, reverse transcriptase zinc-binding domain protein [Tanacetum coccineum]